MAIVTTNLQRMQTRCDYHTSPDAAEHAAVCATQPCMVLRVGVFNNGAADAYLMITDANDFLVGSTPTHPPVQAYKDMFTQYPLEPGTPFLNGLCVALSSDPVTYTQLALASAMFHVTYEINP